MPNVTITYEGQSYTGYYTIKGDRLDVEFTPPGGGFFRESDVIVHRPPTETDAKVLMIDAVCKYLGKE